MKPAPLSPKRPSHWRASDALALAQLATQAVSGVTDVVEGVHQSVWASLGAPGGAQPGRTRGLTGLVYRAVRSLTRQVGHQTGRGLTAALARPPRHDNTDIHAPSSMEREAVLAALNGVMGDHLAAINSPLATPMQLHCGAQVLGDKHASPVGIRPQVLLAIHGLCMNDLQWQTSHEGQPVNHAAMLAESMGSTLLQLRYNTGRHVSSNGHDLAALLEAKLMQGEATAEHITVLTHSMGGLLIRSALAVAQQAGMRWPGQVRHIVFMGTPHHGAPLERAGNRVDVILQSTPFTAPLAQLARLRSSGITDLRFGLVQEADWQGRDRFRRTPDARTPLPLPEGVACYAIAATLAAKRSAVAERVLGDGLVPLPSALGEHADARQSLLFQKSAQHVVYRTGHLGLLSSPKVAQQLRAWLLP